MFFVVLCVCVCAWEMDRDSAFIENDYALSTSTSRGYTAEHSYLNMPNANYSRPKIPKKDGWDVYAKETSRPFQSYQFKISLPATIVGVTSVIPIFERLPVKVVGFRCCGQKGFGFVVNLLFKLFIIYLKYYYYL